MKLHILSIKTAVCLISSLLLAGSMAYAQNTLRGKVTDASGQPLPGVTVMVEGTGNGTTTDLNGNYTLSVPSGAKIVFSCLGMATIQREYKGQAINVSMSEDSLFIEDVVVVGYGTAKKGNLTSAVSAIKGEELLKAPATNVSQVLAGRLPGISSVQESGEPGLDQASLRIRGSVYGVSYVVDGFPVSDINDIDPADIESISVLKDGASAAVYGLKAAGGVIIITTKKGDRGDSKISYNGSYGLSMNANFPQFMDGPQFAYYYNVARMMDQLANGEINSSADYVPYFTQKNIEAMRNSDPEDGWDNVDYIGRVFGTGITQKHNITIQGGNEKGRYFSSIGTLGQRGNIDRFNYRRYNIRTNIEGKAAKHLKYTVGISGVISQRNTPAYLSGGGDDDPDKKEVGWFSISRQTIQMHPYLPIKKDGIYTGAVQNNQSYLVSPLAAIYESGYKDNRGASISVNASLQYDVPFIKGLSLKASGSYDYGVSYSKNLSTPYEMMQMTKDEDGKTVWRLRTDNPHVSDNVINLGEGSVFSNQIVGQAGFNYLNSFGKHNLDLMTLAEMREYRENQLAAYVKKLPFAELPELSNGIATNNPVSGKSKKTRSIGYVFRAKYDYAEKYLIEFTGRYDGSYKFAGMANTRWGFFPSASIGWRISKEPFMQDMSFIDDFKIRGSIGLLGNDSVQEYAFLSTYSKYDYNIAYGQKNGATIVSPAYYSSGVPNMNLTWEKTQSWNGGFDLSMWKGLLSMEFDVFYNYTYDMLSYQSSGFPSSMGGYYPSWVNHNAIDGKGMEILLSHRNHFNLFGKAFWYDITASATYSHTRWLVYKDNPNIVDYRKITGKTYGSILCWKADGLFKSEEEIDNSPWYNTRPNIGDIKYVDINGDGKINEDDKGYFGRSNRPRLTFGLNFNFTWNGFDFNAQFTGGSLFDVSMTGTYYNSADDNTIWTQTFKEGGNSPLYLVQNAYSEYNKNGTMPRLTLSTTSHGGDNGLSSTFWIRDGSYLRLKTAQLGYTIPKSVSDFVGISSFRLFVEGQNLFTIDALPEGIDPEAPGVNNGYYPQQRLLMGGVTLTF